MLKVNETPVRTSRNFNINNAKLEDVEIPKNIGKFENVQIIGGKENTKIDNRLTYGLGNILEKQVRTYANQQISFEIDKEESKEDKEVKFKFDKDNLNLVENLQIIANENSKATVIIKYESTKDINAYHNGIIYVYAHENAKLNIIIVNLINESSNNFLSIESNLRDNANVEFTIVDFGGKNSITNYYSNLEGTASSNKINTIYLGKKEEFIDINYITHLKGEKSIAQIEVQGALKDRAKKNFKGTIDFKQGSKKAKGRENESCMLLSDKAKSLALPMLLCSEEDVEGEHSTSSGKIGEKELFYIMSRGFNKKEAEKLLVKAKFNKILDSIKNEELKEQIVEEIDKRL